MADQSALNLYEWKTKPHFQTKRRTPNVAARIVVTTKFVAGRASGIGGAFAGYVC